MEMSRSLDLRALKQLVSDLLKAEMETWERLQQWLEIDGDLGGKGVCFVMTEHFIQWSARRAKALHEELDTLRGGRDAYISLMQLR